MKKIFVGSSLLLLVIATSTCSGSGPIGEINQNPEIALLVPSVKDNYPEANQLALDWKPNAKLMQVHVQLVNASTSYVRNPKITFQFSSEEINDEVFGVICTENKCAGESYQILSTLLSHNIRPILIDMIQVDSIDAVLIALENGGAKYFHSQEAFDLAHLKFNEDNLFWAIRFTSEEGNSFGIAIDALTGNIIE